MISAFLGLALLSQNASPKSVSVQFQFATVQEVCNELAKQSAEKIVVAPDLNGQTIALELTDRTLEFSLEAIANVLGCKTEKLVGEWKLGLLDDGRPRLEDLRKQAEMQEKDAYQRFVEEFRLLGKKNPWILKKDAELIKFKVAELEKERPESWRTSRRQLLNKNRMLLELVERPELLLAMSGTFSAESLLAGTASVVFNHDARQLDEALGLGISNPTAIASVVGMIDEHFRVNSFFRNDKGEIEFSGNTTRIFSEVNFSERDIVWTVGSAIQKVPMRECGLNVVHPFSRDQQLTPGECIAAAAQSVNCDFVSTTDRSESIQKPLVELSKWADGFVQQNGGAIGWRDDTLLYRHVRFGQCLLRTQVKANWNELEAPAKFGLDPTLGAYSSFLNNVNPQEVRWLGISGEPLSNVSNWPFRSQAVTRLIGNLAGHSKGQLFDHVAVYADSIGQKAFIDAFLECVLKRGDTSAGRTLLRYVESDYSIKDLQAFCDIAGTGKVVVREPDGRFSTVSQSSAEISGKPIVGKVMDYRYRFGYSDAESAGVTFFLRVPVEGY